MYMCPNSKRPIVKDHEPPLPEAVAASEEESGVSFHDI